MSVTGIPYMVEIAHGLALVALAILAMALPRGQPKCGKCLWGIAVLAALGMAGVALFAPTTGLIVAAGVLVLLSGWFAWFATAEPLARLAVISSVFAIGVVAMEHVVAGNAL